MDKGVGYKGIGFSRFIKIEWLDLSATLSLQDKNFETVYTELHSALSNEIPGYSSRRHTISILVAIWYRNRYSHPVLFEQAQRIYPLISSQEDRLWLHYGLALLAYPFFQQSCNLLGQLGRLHGEISRQQVKDSIALKMGHLGSIDRSVERIISSLSNWGTLDQNGAGKSYHPKLQVFSAPCSEIETWLLACALQNKAGSEIPFNDLLNLPELFPFRFTIGVDQVRNQPTIEVSRQGVGMDMVRSVSPQVPLN